VLISRNERKTHCMPPFAISQISQGSKCFSPAYTPCNLSAQACGAIGCTSDCVSEGMGIDPHSRQQQSKAIFSVHLNRQDCSGSSELLGPYWLPSFPGWLSPSAESPMVGANVQPKLSLSRFFRWFRVVRSLLTPQFPRMVISVRRITNGGCGR
jgi:hypothetical protein